MWFKWKMQFKWNKIFNSDNETTVSPNDSFLTQMDLNQSKEAEIIQNKSG